MGTVEEYLLQLCVGILICNSLEKEMAIIRYAF